MIYKLLSSRERSTPLQTRETPRNTVPERRPEDPWASYTLANQHLCHTAVNTVLTIPPPPPPPPPHCCGCCCCCCCCCCRARCGSDVFISLSRRKCLQLWWTPSPPGACHTPCFHGSPSGGTAGRLSVRGPLTTCSFQPPPL